MELIATILVLGFAIALLAGAGRFLWRARQEQPATASAGAAPMPVGKGLAAGLGWREITAAVAAVALVSPLLGGAMIPLPVLLGGGLAVGGVGILLLLGRWSRLAWPLAAALLTYGAFGLARLSDAADAPALGLFLGALVMLGLSLAWEPGAQSISELWRTARGRESWGLGLLLLLGSGGLICGLVLATDGGWAALATLFLIWTAVIGAAHWRPGLAAAPLALAACAAAMIALWASPANIAESRLVFTALGLGLMAGAGGALLAMRPRGAAFGAALAGFGPLAILLAAASAGSPGLSDLRWGLAALALCALNLVGSIVSPVGRRRLDRELFLYAATAALITALLWLGGLSLAAPATLAALLAASGGLRLHSPALRHAAALLAAAAGLAAIARLGARGAWAAELGAVLDALLAVLALWYATRLLGAARSTALERVGEAAMIVVLLCGQLHLASAGLQFAPDPAQQALLQMGLQGLVFAGSTLLLASLPDQALSAATRKWAELGLLAAAALYLGMAGVSVLNPWWGMQPAAAPGWPLLNTLMAGYLLPGLVFALYARLKQRQQAHAPAGVAAGLGAGLLGLWGVLEARRFLTGPILSGELQTAGMLQIMGSIAALALAMGLLWVLFAQSRPLDAVRRVRPPSHSDRRPALDPNLAPPT